MNNIVQPPRIDKPQKLKGRIKIGTPIFQDHYFLTWPQCLYGSSEWTAPNPNMVFDMTFDRDGHIKCTAPGFGMMTRDMTMYGSGAIHIRYKTKEKK